MKLDKANFKKDILGGGGILYTYECNNNKFYIRIMGMGGKDIFVYKNDEFDTNYENENIYLNEQNLDADESAWINNRMDSKFRAAIKKLNSKD